MFAQEQLLSKKGGRLRLLSLSWSYTQQALANIKNKVVAKFGISINAKKANCFCAGAALLSKKGGRLRLLSLSWTYTQQALANIKNKAMAKFGISKNVRKANCFCARAALEQERGQATASEFELDLHTQQSYG